MTSPSSTTKSLCQEDLERFFRGNPDDLDVHLVLAERDVTLAGTKTTLHCHFLAVDANGRTKVARLAEFMRSCVLEYAIPRHQIANARQHLQIYSSTDALVSLHEDAKRLFTHLEQSGEGGELLLFLLAERFLRMPQVLCKMSLKSATEMHYHGADGVYASVAESGTLLLYWGESKVYSDPTQAIRACLASLSPFLLQPESEDAEREQDLYLLHDGANLDDPEILEAFKRYFDKRSPLSNRVRHCGIALVGFDASCYPSDDVEAVADEIAGAIKSEISGWSTAIGRRIEAEKLDRFDIHFFCLPLPSAEGFRSAFRKVMGFRDEANGSAAVANRGRPRTRTRTPNKEKCGSRVQRTKRG